LNLDWNEVTWFVSMAGVICDLNVAGSMDLGHSPIVKIMTRACSVLSVLPAVIHTSCFGRSPAHFEPMEEGTD